MGGASLPPGFRFHPTDEELLGYYLKRKVEGLEIELEVIPVIDLYKFDPWELPDKSFLPNRDMEWFFFCPRDRKYPNGSRTNRATKVGYWKATGKDRKVLSQSSVIGYRKTLVFYRGRAPLGDRTDWVMHEYRLCDDSSQASTNFQGAFVLCRIVKKNDNAHKGDCHGESKAKRVEGSPSNGDFSSTVNSNEPLSISSEVPSPSSYTHSDNYYTSPITAPYEFAPITKYDPASKVTDPANLWVSPDLILDSSKEYTQGQETISEIFQQCEFPYSGTAWKPYFYREISSNSSCSNFTEEVESAGDFRRIGCMSPYQWHPNFFDWCGNEDIPQEGYEHINSLRNPEPF
ncbi:NAC domain-containing protein 71-like isoform X1 [Malania oleifera]|uniref:NAC domain-containing protein 71-like isoform X1 n=1 Tax=Malania oleifera TaxID=397392 RepID=UPI0025AE3FFB|nr:NAC domain-containing protein 71-like isoform X1 [Malania oleifera]